MADDTVRGQFVWHELMTPNGAGAHAFYTQILGWKTQSWEHDRSYSMFVANNGPLGASVEHRTGIPQWVAYVGTPDVAATVDAAVRLGGTLLTPPTVVPKAGTYAVLADPQGATFAVHASSTPTRPAAPPGQGEFSWHELATTTAPKDAFAFYATLFGWDEISQFDMGSMGPYLIFGRNGRELGGMFNKGEMGRPGPAYWVGYVRVPNVDDTVAKAKAARGVLLNGPMDVPGGDRVAQLMDPHGAFFAVHTVAADAKAAPAPKQPARAARKTVARAPAKKKAATKPAKKISVKKKTGKRKTKKTAPRRPAKKRTRPAKKTKQKTKKKRVAAKKKPAPRRSKRKRKATRRR